MPGMGEVIDVDSYVPKTTASAKQEVEVIVIDLDSDVCNDDTNVVPVDSYSNAAVEGTTETDIVDHMDLCSNSLIDRNPSLGNNNQVSMKVDNEEAMPLTTTTKTKTTTTTTTRKAPVPADQWVPDHVKENYHVIEMEGAVYEAMLTQTNVANNSNDFYVIQVLKANDSSSYMVFNRWGRVGEKGDIELSGPHSSCSIAISKFEETFLEKTKNHWSERTKFVSYPKCYTWLEMDYKRSDKKVSSLPHGVNRTFGPRVEKFMSVIINFAVMTKHMTDIGYDAEKLPLNNLSKSTIMKAYDVLKLIAEVMPESPRELLQELSGEFYTIIPHVFGDKRLRDFTIDSPSKLRAKLEMVEALGEIENASKLLANCSGKNEADIMLTQYQLLRCALAPVESSTKEFEMIANYMKNTAGSTNPEIIEIFRVSKEGEDERFKKYDREKNRMLLWHGSGLTNFLGILSKGLCIAPANVPLTGASFGRGLYFSDMFAKSSAYTFRHYSSPTATSSLDSTSTPKIGLVLLCEVALGEMQELERATSTASRLPAGKMSTKGLGQTAPSELKKLEDGVVIPTGKAVKQPKGSLSYNEYIVYKEDQVKMRYIVQVDYKRPA